MNGPVAGWLATAISSHGAWAVGILVGLESLGLPLPGETALVAAAIYAGTTGNLSITGVLGAALAGAVIGDSLGFWAGRRLGWPFLLRHGRRIGLTPRRLDLGRTLFLRHGGRVVFFGRFVAFLRVLAASLAGALGMAWPRFLACNAAGAAVWVSVFGGGAYALGTQVRHLFGPLGIVAFIMGLGTAAAGVLFVRREEARLLAGIQPPPWPAGWEFPTCGPRWRNLVQSSLAAPANLMRTNPCQSWPGTTRCVC